MNDFQLVTVSEATENFNNIRIPLSAKQRKDLKKIYPYYGAQSIIDYVEDYLFDGEYILVAEDGENLKSQNSPVCNLVNGKFWVNNHAHIIRAKPGFNTKYLYYYLNLVDFKPYITGSAQPKLTKDNLNSIPLNIHFERAQDQIAKILSDLDAKIDLNNRINSELEGMAKLIYDYWFVQFDFPISEAQAAAMGRPELKGKPYKSSGGKMVFNKELKREVPEGWEDGTFDNLGEIIGGSTPSRSREDYFDSNGIAWITPKDLSDNKGNKFITKGELSVSELGLISASLRTMPKGTILLSSRAPIGYLAIAGNDVTTNQGFKSFVPSNGFSTPFIFYTIQNSIKTIEQYASGSTFKEISTSVLRSIKTVLPVRSIVKEYTEKVKSIFERQELCETENRLLSELRDWLLPMLMNGQVRVMGDEGDVRMAAEPEAKYSKS